jgi:two-component system, NarL family, nitrate/nitrite response regulator NarL
MIRFDPFRKWAFKFEISQYAVLLLRYSFDKPAISGGHDCSSSQTGVMERSMAPNASDPEIDGPEAEAEGGARRLPRVLIVSDVRLYREGLASVLAAMGRVEIVGTVAEHELASCAEDFAPDVMLLDFWLLGSRSLATMLGPHSTAKSVAFAVSYDLEDILACAEAGVSGFVGKDGSAEDVMAMIDGVACGELPCPPRIAGMLFKGLTTLVRSQFNQTVVTGLSRREFEVIHLVDQGRSNKEIAHRLGISAATVKNHVHHILQKLQVHQRGEAAAGMRSVVRLDTREALRAR